MGDLNSNPPLGVKPREIWLEDRAGDLSRAIFQYATSVACDSQQHALVKGWIEELADVWELIESKE